MGLLRLTGAFLLFLCGWAGGVQLAHRASARRAALEQTARLLERIEEEIRYRKASMEQILAGLRREPEYASLLPEGVALQALAPPGVFSAEEKALFSECFSGAGHGGCAAECRRLQDYRRHFTRRATDAAQREKQVCRVYPRLGLGAGAMLAILVL